VNRVVGRSYVDNATAIGASLGLVVSNRPGTRT